MVVLRRGRNGGAGWDERAAWGGGRGPITQTGIGVAAFLESSDQGEEKAKEQMVGDWSGPL